jgi:methyl-accepting chemotaxis protein
MRLTVKLRLGSAFAVVIALAAASAGLGISSLGSLNASINEFRQGPVERALLETELSTDLMALSRAERSLILAPTEELSRQYEAEIAEGRKAVVARRDRLNEIASEKGKQTLAGFSVRGTNM